MTGLGAALRTISTDDIRAIQLALRGDVSAFDVTRDPVPRLRDLVADRFTSVTDAEERLAELETRLCDLEDRRAIFLAIYVRMTERVRTGLAEGLFRDSDWMRDYLLTFAEYYRRSFHAYECGTYDAVPDPWRIAFGAAIRGDGLVIQDAFRGVNAHINYDLALAIRDVGIDPDRSIKYDDHRQINAILSRLVDIQQTMLADLYAPGLDQLDATLGRLDETMTLRSMTTGRESAWRVAVVLTDVDSTLAHRIARWIHRNAAIGGALFITGPSLDPAVIATLRDIEQDQIDLHDLVGRFHARASEDE